MSGKTRASAAGLALVAGFCLAACESSTGTTYARRIDSNADLIGGPGALGTIGDYLIGNSKIRVIIQDQGWSRGFGVFGGGIIDADIVRPDMTGDTGFGNGRDNYGEFFPALFLEAWDISDQEIYDESGEVVEVLPGIEVICDGSEPSCDPVGTPAAMIRTRASGGDFLTMISLLLEFGVPRSVLRYETDYIIRPGARHLEIIGRVINADSRGRSTQLPLPKLLNLLSSLGVDDFQLPLGDVALFGDGNTVFAPGAVYRPSAPDEPKPVGFDLRFSVEATYESTRNPPALPGLVTDFLATAGPGVSYGYAVGDSDRNFVWLNRDEYSTDPNVDITRHSMLVPFLIDSFTGAFYEVPPNVLEAREMFEYTKYFIVGDGDIASIRDELYEIRGVAFGELYGEVLTQQTGEPAAGTWVQIFDDRRRPYNQIQVDEDGRFRCRLEPGIYYWVVTGDGRYPYSSGEERFSAANRFAIENDADGVFLKIYAPRPGQIIVNVRDEAGRALPAKVTAVLPYRVSAACAACNDPSCDLVCAPRNYLFEFSLGEHRRQTDLNWREKKGERNGKYIEKVLVGHDGEVRGLLRPSPCGIDDFGREVCTPYELWVSRGPEYDVEVIEGVKLEAGQVRRFDVSLERVVDTENYVSADLHVHAYPSADSFMPLDERVTAGAAEALEILVATDHNVITDYAPAIAELGLGDWLTSMIGVEMTTLEMGHFNAYPLIHDRAAVNHLPFIRPCEVNDPFLAQRLGGKANETSLDWFLCSPTQLFDQMRDLGAYGRENTIVQVNHPRDTILGYFNQYYLNPYTMTAEDPTAENYGAMTTLIDLRPHPYSKESHQYNPAQFTLDFDAVEILNGKRQDLIHAFRTPQDAPPEWIGQITDFQCGDGHSQNGRGEVLLSNGGLPSYPGAMDDWLRLLNLGHTITAVANSDSHHIAEEIGVPRTYLYVPPDAATGERRDDDPAMIHDLDVVEAIQKHRAFGTNGPMLTMAVLTEAATDSPDDPKSTVIWRIGSLVNTFTGSSAGREVKIQLTLKSAPWINVDRVVVYANGQAAVTTDGVEAVFAIPDGRKSDGRDEDDEWVYVFRIAPQRDTVLVAEAYGDEQLFPIVPGKETPPANLNAALASLMSAFGGGSFGTFDGIHGPSYIQRVYPYAFTNPIWLDIDADGDFDRPGLSGLTSQLPDEKLPSSEMPECAADGTCPFNQICDHNQNPARCRCFEVDAVRAAGVPGMPVPRPSLPEPHRHYSKGDIRAVFYGYRGH